MSPPTTTRGCPPSTSISIPPQKRRKLEHEAGRDPTINELSAIYPIHPKISPNQPPGSGTGAEEWFHDLNQYMQRDARKEPLYDEEPPFYLSKEEITHRLPPSSASSRVFGNVKAAPADSEKADLRDVIDDLTIENKRLKQKLRSHRSRTSRTPSSRAEDRLLEVRVHGMPADKKRELEQLLKDFAVSLEKDKVPSRSTASRSSDQLTSLPSLSSNGPAIHTTKPLHTDSGYASNSTSGTGYQAIPIASSTKNHMMRSYLHSKQDPLLPRESHHMSDKAKKALVVRRLEQLFTGRQASPGTHRHPLQQQEVSKSAAYAERQEGTARSAKNIPEGSREAHILPADVNLGMDFSEAVSPVKSLHSKIKPDKSVRSPLQDSTSGTSGNGSPAQRPTRPLDLDMGRAQVALENIEYIRHLGVSTPGVDEGGAKKDSWIYLNLLINMAQLHTLNVTPDFVRQAIKNHSTKFELSKDLRQVRWKGGADTTQFSKETERAMELPEAALLEAGPGSSVRSKNSKTDTGSNGRISLTPSDGQTSREESSSNAVIQKPSTLGTSHSSRVHTSHQSQGAFPFDYKPLFHKRKGIPRRVMSPLDDSGSSAPTESTESADRTNRSKPSGDSPDGEGVLTFFNNSYFCSDLSADKHPPKPMRPELSSLNNFSNGVLGIAQSLDMEESALRHHDACYFAPQFAAKFTPPKRTQSLHFDPIPIVAAGEPETQPMEMAVCGLGMTVPADNFAIDVQVAREYRVESRVMKMPKSRLQKPIASRYFYGVQRADRIQLQPSRLPPPSYVFFTSSSSSAHEVDDSTNSSDSSSVGDEDSPAPAAFLRHFESISSRDSSTDGGTPDDENEEEDDSSVDLLQIARANDPEGVAAREREYLLTHPGAAMVVPPSLAATVGTCSIHEQEQSSDDDMSP